MAPVYAGHMYFTTVIDRKNVHIRQAVDRSGKMLEDWKRLVISRWDEDAAFERENGRSREAMEKELERERLACGPGMEGKLTP